jgi:cation:H+ antiporter
MEGLLLVTLLILINWYFFKKLKNTDDELNQEDSDKLKKTSIAKAVILTSLGIIGLYIGSDLFVDSAVEISLLFGVSERVIGVTVIAVGTSMPELTTSIIAAMNKKTDIAIGNIIGSNIMNVLAIIGMTSLVLPIPVSDEFLRSDFIWMLGITIALFPILRTHLKISRWEGGILILVYVAYIITIL